LFSPFKIVTIFFVLSVIGALYLNKLSLSFTPTYSAPTLQVNYRLPNASPEQVEQQVTSVLENGFSQISAIQHIKSESGYNNGRINIEFRKGVNLDFKKLEAQTIVRHIYPKLPADLSYPLIKQQQNDDEQQGPLLVYDIIAPYDSHNVQEFLNKALILPLQQEEGVQEVILSGVEPKQIKIYLQQHLLKTYGIDQEDIINEIKAQFDGFDIGLYRNKGGQEFYVKSINTLNDINQLKNLFVIHKTDAIVRLKDIAQISIEEKEAESYYRVNGSKALILQIYARNGSNRINLANKAKEIVLKASLPIGYGVYITYDESTFIETELQTIFFRAGLSLLILLIFIFFLKRNVRYLLILFSGIIVNLCLTALLMYLFDISVHLYTLAGITISFGLIIDNSIIMLDHLSRKNNRKVFLALLAASLTSIAALSLVWFLPDKEQRNLLEFAQVIIIALSVSLIIALWFTPSIYALLIGKTFSQISNNRNHLRFKIKVFFMYTTIISLFARYRKSFVIILILLFGIPIFMLPKNMKENVWYNNTVGSEIYQEKIRPYTDKILGGSLRLFVNHVFDNSGYRPPDETKIFITAQLPSGNTLEQMDYVVQNLEMYINNFEGVDRIISSITSGQFAYIMINFKKDYVEGDFPYILKNKLINRGLEWDGVTWNIWGVGKAFDNSKESDRVKFQVLLKGYNYDQLEQQANILADKLLAHPRIQAVNINDKVGWRTEISNEWLLEFALEPIALRGKSHAMALKALKERSISSYSKSYIKFKDQHVPVNFYPQKAYELNKYQLMNQVSYLNDSVMLNFAEFAKLKLRKTVNSIFKEDRQYLRMVGFDYLGGEHFGDQYLEKMLEEMKVEMPVGYASEKVERSWKKEDTKKQQYGLLLLLAVLIYFICSILFESLRLLLIIVFIIPISFIGLFLSFSLFDFYFDQGGYAAFILLGGLVVNAGIFIVNELNNISVRDYNRAIIKAITLKAQPIILTIISTCLSLIPFLLKGDSEVFWFSLSVGTIGGLIFSTFAVFIFLPVCLWKK